LPLTDELGIDGYLTRVELSDVASSRSVVPPAWHMRVARTDAADNPRTHLGAASGSSPVWARIDGRRLDKEEPMLGGPGWRYLAFWVNSSGGYRPDKVADELFGNKPAGTKFARTSWKLEFDLPAELDAARDVIMQVYAQEAGQAVLWADVNGRLEIPFCHPVPGQVQPKGTTTDWIRAIPARLLHAGRNAVAFNLRPYPGLSRTDPIWIGWCCFICYSPAFR
jgi:hypothetical protein